MNIEQQLENLIKEQEDLLLEWELKGYSDQKDYFWLEGEIEGLKKALKILKKEAD